MLSKKSLDMLEYNGYSIKENNGNTLFRHSSTDQIGLLIILILTGVVVIILFFVHLLMGVGAAVVAFLIFLPIIKRSKGKFKLAIDKDQKFLRIQENNASNTLPFQSVKGVYMHSKFVDEYSSAFKSTSEEHRITIGLETDHQKLIPVFKLISDHSKPSKEMNEVHDYLKSVLS